jgi:hypothetical protein
MSDPVLTPLCPNGHISADRGYCTVCGTTMGGPHTAPDSAPTTLVPSSAFGAAAGHFASPATMACPHCSAQLDESSRFCEVCGYDPETGSLPEAPVVQPAPADPSPPVSSAATTAPPAPAPAPAPGHGDEAGFPPVAASAYPAADLSSPSRPSAPSRPSGPAAGPWASSPVPPAGGPGARPGVVAIITADRPYYDSHYVSEVDFPLGAPARTIELRAGPIAIGRRSRSRGTDPHIDLAGPPEDSAVSHTHASLLPTPDGVWELVDHGSTNGTYVNESPEPLTANHPRRVGPGDRIYVGAWTRITLEPRHR